VLEWVTHGPRGDIVDLYTTLPWELLCDEVAKLQIELRSCKVIAFPKAASGGEGNATFLQPVLHELGPPSNDATSQNKSAERLSGEGGIRTRGTLAGAHDFQSCTFGHSVTSPGVPRALGRPGGGPSLP
jgi:hypothetical protein